MRVRVPLPARSKSNPYRFLHGDAGADCFFLAKLPTKGEKFYISVTNQLDRSNLRIYNKIERLYLWILAVFQPDAEGGRAETASPNRTMKQRLIVCLTVIMTVLFVLTGVACASTTDNYNIAIELSPDTLAEPKEIAVSIKVTNVGETDMPGPVTLYYSNGKQVEEFGSPTLTAGSSKSWSGTWKVTQEQLENGRVTFKLKYSIYNDAGELVNKTVNFGREIQYTGVVSSVEINRTITPTIARKGQEISVTYDVINTGNVDVTDVTIKEKISSKSGTIASVPAGEKVSYTFAATMGTKDLTSQATITYKSGGKTQTEKKDAATIKYGEVKLSAALTADKKGGAVGDSVKLTLKLKNSGTVDFQNLTVTDPVLGEVFTGQTVVAGQTVTLEKDVPIAESTDYQFTVKGEDVSGNPVETASERVSVTAIDPSQVVLLTVEAAAEPEVVYTLPGTVKFHVKVTNASAKDVEDVTVSASGVTLYTFPSILAGETREFTRDVQVSMAGQFRFDAKVKNQLNETETFESNIIPIAYELPTPEPTEAPIVTPPMPVYEEMPTSDGLPEYVGTLQNVLSGLYTVFMVVGVACLALLVVGVVRRIQANIQSAKAQDHFIERGAYRDYTQPSQDGKEMAEPEDEPAEEQEPAADADPADSDLMAETLRKLYPEENKPSAASVTVEFEGEAPMEPEANPEAEEQQAEEGPMLHRRKRRQQ